MDLTLDTREMTCGALPHPHLAPYLWGLVGHHDALPARDRVVHVLREVVALHADEVAGGSGLSCREEEAASERCQPGAAPLCWAHRSCLGASPKGTQVAGSSHARASDLAALSCPRHPPHPPPPSPHLPDTQGPGAELAGHRTGEVDAEPTCQCPPVGPAASR